jgi:hypothetical protein
VRYGTIEFPAKAHQRKELFLVVNGPLWLSFLCAFAPFAGTILTSECGSAAITETCRDVFLNCAARGTGAADFQIGAAR